MSQAVSHAPVLSAPAHFHVEHSTRAKPVSQALTNALVVEHRDEVFARIEADLSAWGVQAQWATSAEEAMWLYAGRPLKLVLAHSHLPDDTGWLFACKLRFAWPAARIWLYTPRCTTREQVLADFIGVEEVLAYGGDLQRLSAELFERLVVASHSLPARLPVPVGAEGE